MILSNTELLRVNMTHIRGWLISAPSCTFMTLKNAELLRVNMTHILVADISHLLYLYDP